jgi:uncharacterized protein
MPICKTKEWIEAVVLNYNLCPFAHQPYHHKNIRYQLSSSITTSDIVEEFIEELKQINKGIAITTLLIFPTQLVEFDDYLDVFYLLEDTINALGEDHTFQVASFHPEYQFADSEYDDASNATNRSPFPMIHILRCIDVQNAIESHSDTLSIPERNRDLMRALFS